MEGTPEQQIQQLKEEYERRLKGIRDLKTDESEAEVHYPQNEAERILEEHQAVSDTAEHMIRKEVPGFEASSHEPGHSVYELSEEARGKVQEWVGMSLNDPSAGVKAAKDSGDPALFDALHGALTSNEVFQKMVKLGKLPELK